eukprot:TRINITY_DN7489_c0_g1_i2.p1 TRINITY_DN7489_c0_g1~~TRINITY_DN7489_c0_g1_i2.p1  ORF type:complete len:502 (-),score=141.62 TRINITY_DN7489_c0_g1_i2:857-2362(-)
MNGNNPITETPRDTTANSEQDNRLGQQSFDQLEHLIFDSGAFIRGLNGGNFLGKIQNAINRTERTPLRLYTIPEVIEEVKDPNSKKNLEFLLPSIKIRIPSPEAVHTVVEFSKKTGDYAALSTVDLKVLALVYQIEKETNGTDHIRLEPKKKIIKAHPPANKTASNISPADHSVRQKEEKNGVAEHPTKSEQTTSIATPLETSSASSSSHQEKDETFSPTGNEDDGFEVVDRKKKKKTNPSANRKKKTERLSTPAVTPVITQETLSNSPSPSPSPSSSSSSSSNTAILSSTEGNPSDDGEGSWITPENLEQFVTAERGKNESVNVRNVGCITTDYAIQNVLLQMNMNLLSIDGMSVKKLKQWILRCHGCGKVTKEMSKVFCPHCGNNTLVRVSLFIGRNGREILNGTGRIPSTRGTIYNIPLPKGGKNNKDLILNEEQYEKALKISHQKKKGGQSEDLFDSDYQFAGNNKSPNHKVQVGYGKKNPNVARKTFGKTNKSRAV